MLKRRFRGIILGAAAAVALAMGTAHADVTVSIDLETGDTVFSLPGLPDGVEYPAELQTVVTGAATFDVEGGGVSYQISAQGPDGPIHLHTSQADLEEGCTLECGWSFRVPFFIPPGEYDLKVTAIEPNIVDPEQPGASATATVHIVII